MAIYLSKEISNFLVEMSKFQAHTLNSTAFDSGVYCRNLPMCAPTVRCGKYSATQTYLVFCHGYLVLLPYFILYYRVLNIFLLSPLLYRLVSTLFVIALFLSI